MLLFNWTIAFLILISVVLFTLVWRFWQHQRPNKNPQQKNLSSYQDNQTKPAEYGWQWFIPRQEFTFHHQQGFFNVFPTDGLRQKKTERPIHPDDLPHVQQRLKQHLQGQTTSFEATYRVQCQQGQWRWLLDSGKVTQRDGQGAAVYMQGSLKDVHELFIAQERLRLFAAIFTNSADAVCIYDHNFQAIEVNEAYLTITQKSTAHAIGHRFHLALYPQQFTAQIKQQLKEYEHWHGEVDDKNNNNERYTLDLRINALRDEQGTLTHYVAIFSDITERKRTENELRRLANTDTLTGLPNRSYFQVNHSTIVRKRLPHALFVFDLDNFKKINDSLSHEVGDLLLCQVAERVSRLLTRQNTLYRIGGDEFALVIEQVTDLNALAALADSLVSLLHTPFLIEEHELVVNGSLGIVLYPSDGETSMELLQNADTAMYHAKYRGGNTYQFFNDTMNQAAVHRLLLENQLRQALKDKQLRVDYQPKINLRNQTIEGLEALARLSTPDGIELSPSEFIPLAEETGMILELEQQVLKQVCSDIKHWRSQGIFSGRVAVNVSARQFNQPRFLEKLHRTLEQAELPPEVLELEITEGMVMSDPEKAIQLMAELNAFGVHLALDDFGTGYSSLAYLKRFPIHCLKIDKAFIDDIHACSRDQSMVAAIISMAHNLGLSVVAEGVEAEAQLAVLQQLNCETVQGYYFSKPLNKANIEQFMRDKKNLQALTL